MPRTLIFALLCVVCAAVCAQAQKTASDWVTQARQAEQFTEKHVVNVDDSCGTTIRKGDFATTSDPSTGSPVTSIILTAGVGTIIDICSTGTSLTQVFKAPELFAGSAVWKVVSTSGYIEGEQLRECKANPGKCCSIFFVPLTNSTATFKADIESCTSNTVDVAITGGTASTAALPPPAGISDAELADATDIEVEATLVFDPSCGLAAPSSEGVDGVIEGTGEGTEGSSPPAPEGADGVVEGASEGANPEENADGVVEGSVLNGESEEGESTGRRLRASTEEGDSNATTFGAAAWYWSKGHTINKNSLVDPDAPDPMEGGVSEGGEGSTGSAPSPVEGASAEGGVQQESNEGSSTTLDEGEGSRKLLSERRLGAVRNAARRLYTNKLMYEANETPIQMVVNATYKLQISMIRAPAASYFSAAELFANSLVRNIEDSGAVIEFNRPTAVELYPGVGYFFIYMKPLKAGMYTFKSTDDAAAPTIGRIEVVNSVNDLGDSKTFKTHDVGTAACGANVTSTEAQQNAARSGAALPRAACLTTLLAALAALAALL